MAYQKIITEKYVCDYCGEEIFEEFDFKKLVIHDADPNYKNCIGESYFHIDVCRKCLVKIFEKAKNINSVKGLINAIKLDLKVEKKER